MVHGEDRSVAFNDEVASFPGLSSGFSSLIADLPPDGVETMAHSSSAEDHFQRLSPIFAEIKKLRRFPDSARSQAPLGNQESESRLQAAAYRLASMCAATPAG